MLSVVSGSPQRRWTWGLTWLTNMNELIIWQVTVQLHYVHTIHEQTSRQSFLSSEGVVFLLHLYSQLIHHWQFAHAIGEILFT